MKVRIRDVLVDVGEFEDADVETVFSEASSTCDPARELRRVLALIVAANFQEAESDSDYGDGDAERRARLALFLLATKATRGYRWPEGSEP